MKGQAFNPYLPSWEYVPDAEPHIVDGRVYIYGSHDIFNGINFCLGDYVCWSAPVDDLGNWTYHGVIYKREQDPAAPWFKITNGLAAPDMVQGPDGKYYLYYFMGGTKMISVAVCDQPAGKYEFYGYVHYNDEAKTPIGKKKEPFQFDPGIFKDDDGRLYLYTGFAFDSNPILLDGSAPTREGAMVFEIDTTDMLTVKMGPQYIGTKCECNAKGTSYEGHPFAEASSMRKFGDTYYFIYSSLLSHELCYATSDNPTSGFEFGGTLISIGDIGLDGITDVKHARDYTGNTHGSLIKIGDDYFVFYHRHTNRKQSSRQACAEKIRFEDGKFYQAERTSCGLNGKPLAGKGTYPSYIACNLYGKDGTMFYSMIKHLKKGYPYITQPGRDRDGDVAGPDQYVANLCEGAVVGYKYFDLADTKEITVKIKGNAKGVIVLKDAEKDGKVIARIPVQASGSETDFSAPMTNVKDNQAIYFTFEGSGSYSLMSFTLS